MDSTKINSTYLPTITRHQQSQTSTPTLSIMTPKTISTPEDFPSASLPTEMASKPTSTEDLRITLADREVINNYFQRWDELRNQEISWIHSDFKPQWICGNFKTTVDGRNTCSSLHYFTTSSLPADFATFN